MNKTRITVLTLVLFALVVPTVALADSSTNEAITDLSVTFTGQGEDTYITVQVTVNSIAQGDENLKIKAWIDEKNDNNLLSDTITNSGYYHGLWDVNSYAEGMHTLYVAFDSNTTDELTNDPKADNQLSLVFATQEATAKPFIEFYSYMQFLWSKTVRTQLNGWFSFMDNMPLYYWIIIFVIVLIAIAYILRARKKGKFGKRTKSIAYAPAYYARQGYNNHQNYRNEFRNNRNY